MNEKEKKNNNIKIIPWEEIKTKFIRTSNKSKNITKNIFIYDINYHTRTHAQFLLLQTPKLYLPFGVSKTYENDERNQLHLSFQDQNKEFIDIINNIDKYFIECYPDYQLMNSIKQNEDKFYPPYLKVKIPNITKGFQVYDVFNNSQKLEYLVPGTWLTSLIYLKHLWINEQDNIMGLGWYILQTKAKIPIPILDHCIINDDWENETLCAICYSKILKQPLNSSPEILPIPEGYENYIHMLKLGIPLLAVIQKCQMDGMDPEVLHKHKRGYSKSNNNNNPPLPPPLPKFNNQTKENTIIKRIKISDDELLQSRSRLGKSTRIIIKKQEKIDPRVPSLDMILKSMKKLKKFKEIKEETKIKEENNLKEKLKEDKIVE